MRDQLFNVPAQQLRSSITEELLGARVDQLDPAVVIDDHNSGRAAFDEDAQILFLCDHLSHSDVEQSDHDHVDGGQHAEDCGGCHSRGKIRVSQRQKEGPGNKGG
nr:hypothetical protein [Mesorhizobium sp.]